MFTPLEVCAHLCEMGEMVPSALPILGRSKVIWNYFGIRDREFNTIMPRNAYKTVHSVSLDKMEARQQDNKALNNVAEDHLAELPFRQWFEKEQRARAQLTAGPPPIGEKSVSVLRLQLLSSVALRSR